MICPSFIFCLFVYADYLHSETLVNQYCQSNFRHATNEKQPEPDRPLINPNVFPTGCKDHANIYWIYLIDTRQIVNALAYEPRFLSITPDTGLLELQSNETSSIVAELSHQLLLHEQHVPEVNITHVAIPLVTGVWYHPENHIPSPPIRVLEDGTAITNYPESLALWAKVNDSDRTALADAGCLVACTDMDSQKSSIAGTQQCRSSVCSLDVYREMEKRQQRYWSGITAAVRSSERDRTERKRKGKSFNRYDDKNNPHTYRCKHGTVRFGVHDQSIQINFPISHTTLKKVLSSMGYGLVDDNNNTSTGNKILLPVTKTADKRHDVDQSVVEEL